MPPLLATHASVFAVETDPWFARDKYLHGGVSAALALTGYGASALVWEEPRWRFLGGAGFALALGSAKELADLVGPGDASWKDFSWNVVGTASGLLVAWWLDAYVF
ncbi:MAG: hypothetical protein KA712_07535 [Myxococcales bacterium]|nr:hypothetical protein [Myxococcales bacterium]